MAATKSNKIKIMHCGDIHLGGIYAGVSPEDSARLRERLLSGFISAVEAEISAGANAVLISGDLFDFPSPDVSVVNAIVNLFSSHPSVQFVIAPGECDCDCPLYFSKILPENASVFTKGAMKRITLKEQKLAIWGWSMTKNARNTCPLAGKTADNTPLLKIVLGHCDVTEAMSSYFSVLESDISAFGADLCLFSHQHSYGKVKRAGDTPYVYSGFFDGRNQEETGYGGYNVITATDGGEAGWQLSFSRKQFTSHRYVSLTVNVDKTRSVEEALERCDKLISDKKVDKACTLYLTFTGNVRPEVIIPNALPKISEKTFSLNIVNETLPLFECDYLMADKTVPGEIFRKLRQDMESDSKSKRMMAASVFRTIMIALEGKDINNA